MKKYTAIIAAVATIAGTSFAQLSTQETNVESRTNMDGSVSTTERKAETKVDGSSKTTVESEKTYTTRLNNAYRAAGLEDAQIERLREIDMEARAAIEAGNQDRIKTYYERQAEILNPQQIEKVRVWLRENPAPNAKIRTTYEVVPTGGAGVSVNTPIGSVGIGTPQGETVVERNEVVPAD